MKRPANLNFIAVLAVFPLARTPAQELNALTPAEAAAGFRLLFDGENRGEHWRDGEKGQELSWPIDDHALKSPKRDGVACTRQMYDNYEFKVDWKVARGGNSGIFWRVDPDIGWFCSGPEYAILDNENGNDRREADKRAGTNYDMQTTTRTGHPDSPYVDVSRPYGIYNSTVLWLEGRHVEHWLNGHKVVDYELFSERWNRQFQESKFSSRCPAEAPWGRRETGLICVQDHGQDVWFRNIKIRPFTPAGKLPRPWIGPSGGSHAGPVKVALDPAVTGATVYYTLDGSDPDEDSHLYLDTLEIAASVTLRARTFRPGFQPSDIAAATFTLASSGIRGARDLAPIAARRVISAAQGASQGAWAVELSESARHDIRLLRAGGVEVARFTLSGPGRRPLRPGRVEPGLYLLYVRAAGREGVEKVLVH